MRRARALLPIAAYLFVVGMSAFGHWRIAESNANDKARSCVAAWETREDNRDMAEKSYRRNAETLISFANASPDVIAAYQAKVEDDVAEIRATLPDPACDLGAARRRLNH